MPNKLTYVASGPGYIRITYSEVFNEPEFFDRVRGHIRRLNGETPEHTFGILYNAWVEKNFGPILHKLRDDLEFLEADSGGLQVISRGLKITEAIKQEVYENQSKWSDYAMGFDEIPLQFSGDKSVIQDLSGRWFDKDNLEHCAKETGKNFKNQIETFVKNKSKAKPIFVIQGNDYDSFMTWAETALAEIPTELRSKIGGVAIAGSSLGSGPLEDIKRAFFYTQLPDELQVMKHLHLLGVGSITRLLPNIIFLQNGLYKDLHLTYDSTTHTSGIHMGRFFSKEGANLDFGRHFDRRVYTKILEDMNLFYDLGIDAEELHFRLNTNSTNFKLARGSRNDLIETYIIAVFTCVSNFKRNINELISSEHEVSKVIHSNKKLFIFESIRGIKNMADYQHWIKTVSRHARSNPVSSKPPATLTHLFGG
jgi:hypothetical protein